MKNKIIFFLLFAACLFFSEIQAQNRVTIIDYLESSVPCESIMRIDCDPAITRLIGVPSSGMEVDAEGFVKITGFRIQVFMSNNQRTARNEIANKSNLIKTAFPEIAVYSEYVAPNFKLSAGDFLTREEADVFKQKLLKTIPSLGKEMYIIQNTVNIRLVRR